MEPHTLGNMTKREIDTGGALLYSQMTACTLVTGKIIELMGMDDLLINMGMSMKASLSRTNFTERAKEPVTTVIYKRATGKGVNRMDNASKSGQMARISKANSKTA